MIITAGSLKLKKIRSVNNIILRPTSNKIRQAIFNILIHSFDLENWKNKSYMLDAFAGTGIVSFEALSRGIMHSTLVEKNMEIYDSLLDNIKNLNINNNTYTINENFFNIKSLPYKYNLVFLDPPYNKGALNHAIDLINDLKILQKKSILICETEKNFQLKTKFSKFVKKEKYYGRVKLIFLIFN